MIHLNYFGKLYKQGQACLSYGIARNSVTLVKIYNL